MSRFATSKRLMGGIAAFVVAVPVLAVALPARIAWDAGDPIKAADMNANFGALWDAVEALERLPIRESTTLSVEAADGCDGLLEALAELDGRSIAASAEVTIELAPATYACSASVVLQHPYGDRIVLRGTGNTRAQVVLSFPASSDGVIVRGHPIGRIENLTLEGAGKDVHADGTGLSIERGASLHVADVEVSGFDDGVWVDRASSLVAEQIAVQDNSAYGVSAFAASLVLTDATSSGNGAHGFHITEGSAVRITRLSAIGNGLVGVNVQEGAYLEATESATSNDNGDEGFRCLRNATVNIDNPVATGNGSDDYQALSSCMLRRSGTINGAETTSPAPNTLSSTGSIIIDGAAE